MSEAPNIKLPQKRPRAARGGPDRCDISLTIKVVTPILGGSPVARELDDIDVIRPATVRGHLRFWWRALNGHKWANPQELYNEESNLWGRAATDEGGRSSVDLSILVEKVGSIDYSDIHLSATPGAYALFPAKTGTPTANRRQPGTTFTLTLACPQENKNEVQNTLRAWLLFGGYGSRTRRGLGSLTVTQDADQWLPSGSDRASFKSLFGSDIFVPAACGQLDMPLLGGAWLVVKSPDVSSADKAWIEALNWLREFRQGTSGPPGNRAREPGTGKPQPIRPSLSNWPEADKIRHLMSKTRTHPPRHNDTPAWPRAGFGLPIVGRFQKTGRNGDVLDEPDHFELRWQPAQADSMNEERGARLASPLIVKALPLANGSFVPCALWLNRAYPNGKVILRDHPVGSGAPFDRLVAPGDKPLFSALAGKGTLKEAFFDWLHSQFGTKVVAP